MYSNALDLVDNETGFTVIELPTSVVPAREVLQRHVRRRLPDIGALDLETFEFLVTNPWAFEKFRNKEDRIFSKDDSVKLRALFAVDLLLLSAPEVLISDEESLGYQNIYFRCVRPNKESDVGEPHADKWFWDLGLGSMPDGYRRVKVWIPIQMDENVSSFLAIPGSHKREYAYGSRLGADGKRRPIFYDEAAKRLLTEIGVGVGQAVVFHDELIHAGRSTSSLRLSIEFTMVIPERSNK